MTTRRRYSILLLVVVSTALLLSWTLAVPYLFTVTGFSGLAFVGHVVTVDDDMPGGWNNPAGDLPFPWRELAVKAAIFFGLCAAIVMFPALKDFGGAG
jgi:hypothetical protein